MPIRSTAKNPIRSTAKPLPDIIRILKAISNFLKEHYFEREDVVKQLILAVITRQHVLTFGAPGTAKSRLIKSFVSCFEGLNNFSIQMSRYLPEEALIGSLNPKLLREQGVYEYNTNGTIVDSHLAYIDEVFDANDSTLRSLLEILNERTFTKGHTKKSCPLVSAFMASNFNREDKNVEAFCDRILFKAHLTPITESKNKLSMISNFVANDKIPVYDGEKLTVDDLNVLKDKLDSITMSATLIKHFVAFCGEYTVGTRINISDRKLNQLTYILKATALIHDRTEITFDDFHNLKYGLYTIGNKPEEEQAFDALLIKFGKIFVDADREYSDILKQVDTILYHIDHKEIVQEDPTTRIKEVYKIIEKNLGILNNAGHNTPNVKELIKKYDVLIDHLEKGLDKILSNNKKALEKQEGATA